MASYSRESSKERQLQQNVERGWEPWGKHLERGKLCLCPLRGKSGLLASTAGDRPVSRSLNEGSEVRNIVCGGDNEEICSHSIEMGHTLGDYGTLNSRLKSKVAAMWCCQKLNTSCRGRATETEQGGQTRAWGWDKAMDQGRPQGRSSSLILPDGAIGVDIHSHRTFRR